MPHSSPVGARYSVSFVNITSDAYFNSVTIVAYEKSLYVWPRYNGTRLYLVWRLNLMPGSRFCLTIVKAIEINFNDTRLSHGMRYWVIILSNNAESDYLSVGMHWHDITKYSPLMQLSIDTVHSRHTYIGLVAGIRLERELLWPLEKWYPAGSFASALATNMSWAVSEPLPLTDIVQALPRVAVWLKTLSVQQYFNIPCSIPQVISTHCLHAKHWLHWLHRYR